MPKRNVATKENTFVKFGLYKSLILSVLLYGFACLTAGTTEIHNLEKFQKNVVKWKTGNKDTEYKSQLRLLNILPLPMFIQLNDLLLVSKALNEENNGIELPEVHTKETRNNEIFKLTKTRTEKARSQFTFKTCRIANRLEHLKNLWDPHGLKNRILRTMWNFFEKKYSERNICTWQLFCDCQN